MVSAPGETDLDTMLATLGVEQRPGVYTFVEVHEPTAEMIATADAMIVEDESTTLVLTVEHAERFGFAVVIELAWLSLTVTSSLEAVGLTAAISAALAAVDIPCNVLAGYHHDHLLVPTSRASDAIEALITSGVRPQT